MARRTPGSVLATTGATNGVTVHKKQITHRAAIDLVKKLATDRYRAERDAAKEALKEAERGIGGSTRKLDRTLVDQGRAWMTRVALIGRRASTGINASKSAGKLTSLAGEIAGIVGKIEAIILTDVEIGLFQDVDENDYLAEYAPYGERAKDPLNYINKQNRDLRAEALAVLDNYEIVDEKKAAGKAAKSETHVDGAVYEDEPEDDEGDDK